MAMDILTRPHLVQIPDVPHHELKRVLFQVASRNEFEIQFKRLHTDFAVGILHRKVVHEFTVDLGGQPFATGDVRVFLRVVARVQLFQRDETVAVGVKFGKGLVYHGQPSLSDVPRQIMDKFTGKVQICQSVYLDLGQKYWEKDEKVWKI